MPPKNKKYAPPLCRDKARLRGTTLLGADAPAQALNAGNGGDWPRPAGRDTPLRPVQFEGEYNRLEMGKQWGRKMGKQWESYWGAADQIKLRLSL